jgi:hypothetical protein
MEIITVAHIEQPAPGRKQGTLIDTQGNKWKVWPDKLANYAPGNTYDITYKVNNFKGFESKVIENSVLKAAGPLLEGPQVKAPSTWLPPAPTNYTKDEMIFVCGIVNHAVGAGLTVSKANILGVTNAMREVWAETFAKAPVKIRSKVESGVDPDFNDSIPDFPGDR